VHIAAGRYKGRRLPAALGARPVGGRLKTSLFSVLEADLEGASVLDLCAGVGGLGLEALSRGARSLLLVERDPAAAAALRAWIEQVGCGDLASVREGDALAGPPATERFEVVFFDPPFEAWQVEEPAVLLDRALEAVDENGLLVCKLPASVRIPEDSARRLLRRKTVGAAAYAVFLRL
jgi:16S rRNA (guanine966-N2)-methyltransferase